MTQIDIAALVADREAGTQGPWIAEDKSGQKTADGLASNIGVWSQQRWDNAYEANPDDTVEAENAAWILGIWGEIGDEDRANARRIARVPDMEAALIALDAELKRYREALETVAGVGHDMPATWSGDDLAWARRRAAIMQQTARAALGEKP